MNPEELVMLLEEGKGYKIEFKTEGKIRFDELINEKFIFPQDFDKEKI